MQTRLLGLLAVPALVVGLAGCGSSSDNSADNAADTGSSDTPTTSTSDTPSTDTSTTPSTDTSSVPTTDGASSGSGTCTYTASGQAARPVDLPPSTPAYTSKVPGEIVTSAGTLHITLNGDTTPCTVNSFASLAEQGFYDKTPCPRIAVDPGFQLLQCGDPTGTTSGGPGYEFDDELTGKESYPAGTLAMANAGPNTNGSQFFIVYGNTQLSPDYTVFGSVDSKDLSVIEKVAAAGIGTPNPAGGGAPKEKIDIESIAVGS